LSAGALALISLVVSIWSAFEAHRATTLQAESVFLERQVALVESCGEASPALFRDGDDFVVLTGTDGNDEYWNSAERRQLDANRPHKPRVLVRCQFTNLSRVPLLSIRTYYRFGFHHNRTIKEKHSFPFTLAPNATHALWFFNIEVPTVVFSTPDHARYIRFPEMSHVQTERFEPRIRDYWILYRDFDPDEHLDESMMR
jgi:hypothetical protein